MAIDALARFEGTKKRMKSVRNQGSCALLKLGEISQLKWKMWLLVYAESQ
jgi:hypothetical protein